jgi:hypothetical protein
MDAYNRSGQIEASCWAPTHILGSGRSNYQLQLIGNAHCSMVLVHAHCSRAAGDKEKLLKHVESKKVLHWPPK